MSLLRMSLSGAVMILVIVVIRALAIYKLPKSAFLLLWGIAAVRLLIPYSLPSAFSVYSLLGRAAPAAAELGTGFAERFAKYAPFGITYEEVEGAGGMGNVYWSGRLVSRFVDLTPDGGAFSFSSAKRGGVAVKTVYDRTAAEGWPR